MGVIKIYATGSPYNLCAVPWGMFSAVGDIMINVGRYREYHGGGRYYLEYRGGSHDASGEYREYRGRVQYSGGYHPL